MFTGRLAAGVLLQPFSVRLQSLSNSYKLVTVLKSDKHVIWLINACSSKMGGFMSQITKSNQLVFINIQHQH